jgi:hypothetical protein
MTLQFDDENDESQATAALAGWAEQLGFRLTRNEAGGRFTLHGRYNYSIWVAGTAGFRRIVCIANFAGCKNHRDPEGKLRFANKLNLDYNVSKVSFNSQGDLYFEFVLYVEASLSPSLWSTFFVKADDGITWVFGRHKDELAELVD